MSGGQAGSRRTHTAAGSKRAGWTASQTLCGTTAGGYGCLTYLPLTVLQSGWLMRSKQDLMSLLLQQCADLVSSDSRHSAAPMDCRFSV
jgi:hypothetical protein